MPLVRRVVTAIAALVLAAGVALVAAAPGQATPSHDGLVLAWYETFLGRDGSTDPGHSYWTNQLDLGVQPSDVLWALLHSREYNEREIATYYNRYLLHAPDAGAGYWVDNTTYRGMALEWVAQNILASPEYFRLYNYNFLGGQGQGVAEEWYLDVLGRYDPAPADLGYWANRMRLVGVLGALREFWYSDEAVRKRINDTYIDELYRYAGFGELGYWYPKEVESDVNVKTLIGSTPEYLSHVFW